MRWQKSPEALVQKFSELVPVDSRVERRQMFGYPAAFVGGNLFMSLFQDHLILRLPDEPRGEFVSTTGASIFEPMPGRPMREYVVVPAAILEDLASVKAWADRALHYAASLPSKKKKTATKKAKVVVKKARRRS